MSALGRIFLGLGKRVWGSDLRPSKITDELKKEGVILFERQVGEQVPWDTDLFVYSEAEPADHPERKRARVAGIPSLNYFEALSLVMDRHHQRIAVSGTNGKTTTTAMLGQILVDAKKDPTVVVGSLVHQFDHSNARLGKSDLMLAEACEWKEHMMHLHPTIIVLTNIEEDHLDYYRDIQHIRDAFQRYIDRLPVEGRLILNGDDPVSRELRSPRCEVRTYGRQRTADIMIEHVRIEEQRQKFTLLAGGKSMGEFSLRLPGVFNVYNAAAAAACALSLKISPDQIRQTLEEFRGTWRRFQILNPYHGATIISDYAHHPTAIAGTLDAARSFFPERRILAVFQPHHHNRTRRLFNDFVECFGSADDVIISEIYHVAGREAEQDAAVSSVDLVEAMKAVHPSVAYAPNLHEAEKMTRERVQPNDVVVVMGAGDIVQVAEHLGGGAPG